MSEKISLDSSDIIYIVEGNFINNEHRVMDKLITKYNLIFEEIFKIKVTDENKSRLVYKKYSQWDSLAQMTLIQSIEETFRIMIPFDEMMCIDSYEHGLDYLTDKLK